MTPAIDPITAVLGLAGVPVVMALVEATKRVVPTMPSRYFPLVSLAWALALNVGVEAGRHGDLGVATVAGLIVSLAAGGLYSGGRTVTGL